MHGKELLNYYYIIVDRSLYATKDQRGLSKKILNQLKKLYKIRKKKKSGNFQKLLRMMPKA